MFCYVLTAPVRHLPSESPFGLPASLTASHVLNEMRRSHIKAPKLSLLSERFTGSDMFKKNKNATSKFRDVG